MEELAAKAVSASLEEAFKNRNQILIALKAGLRKIKEGQLNVVIVGLGGTGKTTAEKLLTEGIEASTKNWSYIPTVKPTKRGAKNSYFVSIWDTPGQEDLREAAWDEALRSLKKGARCIVIVIVSYGHNSLGTIPFSVLRKNSPKGTREEIIRNYFRLERAREVKLITDICSQMTEVPGKIDILTIINKQDLWWPQKNKVLSHYIDGAYAKPIKKLIANRKGVSHSVKEVCLCNINLKTVDDIVLAPTCAGYDAAMREFYLTHLLNQIKQMVV